MTINNKSESNYRGKCLGWPVTSYGADKVKTNLVPSYISDLFSCDMSRYNLRNTDDFSCQDVTLLHTEDTA